MEESIRFGVPVSLLVDSTAVFSSKRLEEQADSRKPGTERAEGILVLLLLMQMINC